MKVIFFTVSIALFFNICYNRAVPGSIFRSGSETIHFYSFVSIALFVIICYNRIAVCNG